jgi:tripartite-type tricarboxylate transporter receptor subunit TctC
MLQLYGQSNLLAICRHVLRTMVAIFCLVAASIAHSQSITVQDSVAPQSIANSVEYYEDNSEALTISDVLNPQFG